MPASSAPFTISVTLGQSLGDTLRGVARLQSAMDRLRRTAAGVSLPGTAAPASVRRTGASGLAGGPLGASVRAAASGLSLLRMAASGALSAISGGARLAGSLIGSALAAPVRLLTAGFSLLKGAAVGAAAATVSAWGSARAALAAIRPAADFQQYAMQLEVLLGSQERARRRFAELREYARVTNFSPDEVVAAGAAMQAFGIWAGDGMRRLRLAGDAANAFGRSIQEVVTSLNYLAAGRGGEAMESLARMGITREKLAPHGVRFGKAGDLLTSPRRALAAVFSYIERNYGGMTRRMGQTWRGAVAQMGGALQDALADGFSGALRPLSAFAASVSDSIRGFGRMLAAIDWGRILAGPLSAASGLVSVLSRAADPATRRQGLASLDALRRGLGETLASAWRGLQGIASAFLSGLGDILSGLGATVAASIRTLAEDGGLGDILAGVGSAIVSAMRGGAELIRAVLHSFSERFRSDVLVAMDTVLDKIGLGTGEADRRRRAHNYVTSSFYLDNIHLTDASDRAQEYAKAHPKLVSEAFTTWTGDRQAVRHPRVYREWTMREIDDLKRRLFWETDVGKSLHASGEYDRQIAEQMGWGRDPGQADRHLERAAQSFHEAGSDLMGSVARLAGSIDASPLREAVGKAASGILEAGSRAASDIAATASSSVLAPLRREAVAGAMAGERDARRRLALLDAGIAYHRGRGWGRSGETISGFQARDARRAYRRLVRQRPGLLQEVRDRTAQRREAEVMAGETARGRAPTRAAIDAARSGAAATAAATLPGQPQGARARDDSAAIRDAASSSRASADQLAAIRAAIVSAVATLGRIAAALSADIAPNP